MPRPMNERRVGRNYGNVVFKPVGIPARELPEVVLGLDEAEAIRLADLEGLYQEAAARKMGVSRQTLGRILEGARRKVADALVNGKALRLEGGAIYLEDDSAIHTKVALPTQDGMVADERYGRCECFTVFEVEGGAVKAEIRIDNPDGRAWKSDLASALAEVGVGLMIAGDIGGSAARVLKANGIDVIRGASGPARAAVEAWLAGSLKDSALGCGGRDRSR